MCTPEQLSQLTFLPLDTSQQIKRIQQSSYSYLIELQAKAVLKTYSFLSPENKKVNRFCMKIWSITNTRVYHSTVSQSLLHTLFQRTSQRPNQYQQYVVLITPSVLQDWLQGFILSYFVSPLRILSLASIIFVEFSLKHVCSIFTRQKLNLHIFTHAFLGNPAPSKAIFFITARHAITIHSLRHFF